MSVAGTRELHEGRGRNLQPETAAAVAGGTTNEAFDEALSALVMLGFQKSASDKVLRKLLKDNQSATVEDLVRLALKQL